MTRSAAAPLLALLVVSCAEPPKQNRAVIFIGDLQDLVRWDPRKGGVGDDAVDGLLSLEPADSVTSLFGAMLDPTLTRIDDRIHRVPTVGDVAFHLLLMIFQMEPKDFEDEGVWVGKDPLNNPIWNVHLDDDGVRTKCRAKFYRLALERGWVPITPPPKK